MNKTHQFQRAGVGSICDRWIPAWDRICMLEMQGDCCSHVRLYVARHLGIA